MKHSFLPVHGDCASNDDLPKLLSQTQGALDCYMAKYWELMEALEVWDRWNTGELTDAESDLYLAYRKLKGEER